MSGPTRIYNKQQLSCPASTDVRLVSLLFTQHALTSPTTGNNSKISYIHMAGIMAYANSADPDQTAPEEAV